LLTLSRNADQQKEEDKARNAEVKAMEKSRKEEEKASKAEQKRQVKEDKAKGKDIQRESADEVQTEGQRASSDEAAPQTDSTAAKIKLLPTKLVSKRKVSDPDQPTTADRTTPPKTSEEVETEPTSPSSKVKSWWKKLGRSRAVSAPGDGPKAETASKSSAAADEKGFIGGAALASLENSGSGGADKKSTKSHATEEAGSASMREVAMAGRTAGPSSAAQDEVGESSGTQPIDAGHDFSSGSDPAKTEGAATTTTTAATTTPLAERESDHVRDDSDKASSISSLSSDDAFVEAREDSASGLDTQLSGLRAPGKFMGDLASLSGGSTHSVPKESKFKENIE
jgi:hypothetical protein